jgi:hypothetical protein
MTMKKLMMFVICTLALALCTANAFAQADTLKVDYFSNANTAGAPDGTVRLNNPGTYASGNICASIFVFDPNQELSECCSCLLTPDGLRTLSIDKDVTGNPLTGVTLTTGVIKVVSTVPVSGNCPLPTAVNPAAALRAWTTHIQNSNFAVTETASQDATLSAGEIKRLATDCYAVSLIGSGKGVCSCGSGD